MYYATQSINYLYIHEANTGAVHFPVALFRPMQNYNLSGNVLAITYQDGMVEVYDVQNRCRIR